MGLQRLSQRIETGDSPLVEVVAVHGVLRLKGWDRPFVEVAEVDDGTTAEETPEGVRITSAGRCRIRAPHGTRLSVAQARGDLHVKGIHGLIDIDRVSSDLVLRDTGPVHVDHVGALLDARQVHGGLHAHEVGGHAHVEGVTDAARLDHVGGHLHVSDVPAGVSSTVGGNAEVTLGQGLHGASHVEAAGNLLVIVAEGVNAQVEIESLSGLIRVDAADGRDEKLTTRYVFTSGTGGPVLHLKAGGMVRVHHGSTHADAFDGVHFGAEFGAGFAAMAEELAAQVESRMQGWQVELEARLGELSTELPEALRRAGLGWNEAEHVAERVRTAGERAARRAEREAMHAARRAERRAARREAAAMRRSERRGGGYAGEPREEPSTVSEDERGAVLRMLAAGTISAEQADQLLAALGGRRQA